MGRFLPPQDVVDTSLLSEQRYKQEKCLAAGPLRQRLKAEIIMLNLFEDRLQSPSFVEWIQKDRVIQADVLKAALSLKS